MVTNESRMQTLAFFQRAVKKFCEGNTTILPKNPFKFQYLCQPHEVKVIIIGNEPYANPQYSDGLAFANPSNQIHPQLKAIFQELNKDLKIPIPVNGNLDAWASQGVLLLNTVLTCEKFNPFAHRNMGWENYVRSIIQLIAYSFEHSPLVVIVLGNKATQLVKKCNFPKRKNLLIMYSCHPNANNQKKDFQNRKLFSKTNKFLKKHYCMPIRWDLK